MVLEERHLLRGRDVQHVHALAGLTRQPDETLGALQRRDLVAPDRVRARIAFDAQSLALVEPVFVLGVERGAPPDRLEDVAHALVVLDQQRTGGRAHEHLYAGTAGKQFEFRQVLGVLARAAHEEREIAMHAMMRALDLVGECLRVRRGRIGVRHLEHRGDAAHDGAERAGFEIFLVGRTGFAEMHLGVDHARQDMQAAAIDRLARGRRRQLSDRGDPSGRDAEIACRFAVVIDDGAAPEDQIVGLRHSNLPPL